jgi:hypothetical protein
MTPEQIAQAYRTGELNSQTPIWPPGYGGWQALGSIQQLRSLAANDGGGPPALSQYDESEDDPTRMWMGPADEYDIAAPLPPVPAPLPSRPSTRTGPRRVQDPPLPNIPYQPATQQGFQPPASQGYQSAPSQGYQAPAPQGFQPPAFQPPTWSQPSGPPVNVSPAHVSPAHYGGVTTAASRPSSEPPFRSRPRRRAWLMGAGLLGLVGLASAVLAARGNSSEERDKKAAMAEAASRSAPVIEKAPAPVVPAMAEAKIEPAEPPQAAATEPGEEPTVAEGSAAEGRGAEGRVDGKVAERMAPSSTRADEEVAPAHKSGASASSRVSSKSSASKSSAKVRATKPPTVAAKRSPEKIMAEKLADKADKAEKAEKAEKIRAVSSDGSPVVVAASQKKEADGSTIDHEAAAAALSSSSALASSCRPPGGPTGTGKVRVTYNNDGSVGTVEVMPATFAGTTTGSCVSMLFRRAKIPAFKGEPPTFIKSFTIPE